jgi:RimJ/RimL family protein N-acetyltransferase
VTAIDAPRLVTERLELRLPTRDDVWAMHAIATQPPTARFLGSNRPAEHFLRFSRSAGSWLLYGYGSFMVRERGKPDLIGNCGVFHTFRELGADFDDSPEAGWILSADHVGKGYAAEAMTAALDWFDGEHGPRRMVAMIAEGNQPSQRLAQKLGFTPMRDTVLPDGETVRLFERLPV